MYTLAPPTLLLPSLPLLPLALPLALPGAAGGCALPGYSCRCDKSALAMTSRNAALPGRCRSVTGSPLLACCSVHVYVAS
ncbi:hypothetical protein COO60DRAFT_1482509 [Scenedesmus sp. NREL 46B-D3]|nr:hypothetical protein COO60DRAFT_1482509 [Scenedesmus sp. NREL 46B-D3]